MNDTAVDVEAKFARRCSLFVYFDEDTSQSPNAP